MEKKTTTRCERILAAFAHLKEKGLVKTQQDVADMMGANKTTVSQAFKGSEKYLSDKFLARFNATFNDMFNIGWLITGKGDMLDGVQHPADGVMVPVVPLSAVGGTLRDIHQGNVMLEDCEVMRAPVKSKRGNNANTRSIHIRNIRAVFNDAMDAGITVAYPFRRLVPKPVPKKKVILSPMQLRTLFSAEVPDHQRKYIDAFKLMFLLIGINTVDLLTTATIENGRVVYIRAKTHRPYSVKLEPEAADIIARYPSSCGHLISLGDGLKDYRGVTYRMNEALKSVIPGVTTYTARYSWATIAASLDIPKETIARALGHGGHSVTDIYIDFDQGKVDDANRRVIDWVLYGRK